MLLDCSQAIDALVVCKALVIDRNDAIHLGRAKLPHCLDAHVAVKKQVHSFALSILRHADWNKRERTLMNTIGRKAGRDLGIARRLRSRMDELEH
jgi:hypothetical protein